jgi:hypothetical protein
MCKVFGLILPLGLLPSASATVVTSSAFISPVIIDFDAAPATPIGAFYSGVGVTFVSLCGGSSFDTGGGVSPTAANFFNGCDPGPTFPSNGEALFASPVIRVGFDITTNDTDDVTVSAFLGATFVGSHVFDTGGSGTSGSFAGVEFLGGFDRIVIDAAGTTNGAFALDNFRFEADAVPEPASSFLVAGALLGLAGCVRSKRSKSAR